MGAAAWASILEGAAAYTSICFCIPTSHAIMVVSASCMPGSRDPVDGVLLLDSGSGSNWTSAYLNMLGVWVFLTGQACPLVIRPMMLEVSVGFNI